MAQSLPSPPLSRSTTPPGAGLEQSNTNELFLQLDDLLAQYLELLDGYTRAQTALSGHLSEAYFSLARAQRTSSMGAGRRYGRDGYDSRMKATRRVRISQHSNGGTSVPDVTYECPSLERSISHRPVLVTERNDVEDGNTMQLKQEAIDHEEKAKKDSAYRDPATWYGLFVPTPLKDTQEQFLKIVHTSIPSLLTTKASMEALEHRIWDIRSLLGIENHYIKSQVAGQRNLDTLAGHDQLAREKTKT